MEHRRFFTRKISTVLAIIALALLIRGLTANFIAAHLDDPAWFQKGSYSIFDRQARAMLDGTESFFWIPDATRTDLIQYPPANRLWIGGIYALTGEKSAASVQRVQWVIDGFTLLLIIGIAVTAFGWNVGLVAGLLAALSPLLALYAATPGADAPASWFVLASVWCLLLTYLRRSFRYAVLSGAMLGIACWFRVNPLLLFVPTAITLFFVVSGTRARRATLAAAFAASTLLVMTPIIARNLIVFYPEIAPTGLNVGLNLLEGIGETERGAEFGAPASDEGVIEQDRRAMGLPPDAPLGLVYPDGIRRDRDRGRRALEIIRAHPVWFLGVMAKRIFGHLKLAGEPTPFLGSTGINVTNEKCLPVKYQHFPFSTVVTALGMTQSVLRYIALPLILLGLCVGLKSNLRITVLLISVVVYFLMSLAVGHSEIRYGLPMQALLIVFYARATVFLWDQIQAFRMRRGLRKRI